MIGFKSFQVREFSKKFGYILCGMDYAYLDYVQFMDNG